MTELGAIEEKPLEKQGLTDGEAVVARDRADCEQHGKWKMAKGLSESS
jgi:hypothetical protein